MWGDCCVCLVDMDDEACCLACWVWGEVGWCWAKDVALALLLHCCVVQVEAAMEEGCGLLSLVACENEKRRRRQTRRNRRFILFVRNNKPVGQKKVERRKLRTKEFGHKFRQKLTSKRSTVVCVVCVHGYGHVLWFIRCTVVEGLLHVIKLSLIHLY